jgi:hypothetical protein
MNTRLTRLGIVLVVIGVAFVAAGAFAFVKTQEGYRSLNAFSAAQNVKLSYNQDGQLVDRGETTGAAAIMSLLKDDWGYPVVAGDLNPDDPIVNTPTEYMFQMATIAHHTLTGTQTVVLTEPVDYNGTTYAAGTYEVAVDGRYFSDFDRLNPIDGPARDLAWSGTAHALIAELGVGTTTASALQLALVMAGLMGGLGATLILTGGGLVWATRPEKVTVPVLKPAMMPA